MDSSFNDADHHCLWCRRLASILRCRGRNFVPPTPSQNAGDWLVRIIVYLRGCQDCYSVYFNPDAGNLKGNIGFTYVGSCLVGSAISWCYVLEMKERAIREIDRMFELRLPARMFKDWEGRVEEE